MNANTYKGKKYKAVLSDKGCIDCVFNGNSTAKCAKIQKALGFCGNNGKGFITVFTEIPEAEKQKKPNIFRRIFWYIFAVLYFPIYFVAIILVKICAFIAAICYALLHEPTTAKRLLGSLLNKREYGEY